MRSILLLCSGLLAGLMCACAPVEEMPLGDAVVVMNVSGGQFQRLLLESVRDPIEERIELTIDKRNRDPQWAPSGMVCAVVKASTYEACLRISAKEADSDVLYATRLFFKDNKKTLVSQEPVPGTFEMGDRIEIALRSGPDRIEFKVGDGAWLTQALRFPPEAVRLICSSAQCRFRVPDSPKAP
jgi:hypothetical protein